jgi:hypothetical protein
MQDTHIPTETEATNFTDLDQDGGVSVLRRRDYVKVYAWGGAAGATGCATYLSADAAARLGETLIQLAAQAHTYADQTGVIG